MAYEWIYGTESEYFPDFGDKQKNNAMCIYTFFNSKNWTLQSISALCGNVTKESTFNPRLIEVGGTGHGLVQWTPPSDLYEVLDVLYGSHTDWWNGDKQVNVIYAEYQQSSKEHDWGIEGQWYPTKEYPMTWKEWVNSTADPGYLAKVFQANYERPAAINPGRDVLARQWFDWLSGQTPGPGPGRRKRMPLYMYPSFI